MRRAAWFSVAALVLGLAGAARAQLRNVELGFRPPSDSRVIGFHVYLSSASQGYTTWRDDINFVPPVDGSGVARYPLTGLELSDVYVSLRSYDANGAESGFSNEIVLAAVQQCLVTGCKDGNTCTWDTCTPSGCVYDPAPLAGAACDDGNPATLSDQCQAGVCVGFACNADADCSDGQACNGAERCVSHSCVSGTPMACGDGNACNGTESCVGSACVSGAALACPTDSGPCFDSFCDPVLGCRVQTHPDGQACTTVSSASAGTCQAGVCNPTPTTPPPTTTPPPEPTPTPTPTWTCPKKYQWWCDRWLRRQR
jgi:hypothetical protein